VIQPAEFLSFPVGGRELWQVNRLITSNLANHGHVAIIDSRELRLKSGQTLPMPTDQLVTKSDLVARARGMGSSIAQTFVVNPRIERRTRRVTRKRSGTVQAGLEVTIDVSLEIRQASNPTVLIGTVVSKSVTPAFHLPEEGEDPAAALFAATASAAEDLNRRLRSLRGIPQGNVRWLKENLALMVRMDSAQVRSVSAVPNEIERLTQVTFLGDLAYGKLRSREVEKRLELPPGLRVVSPYGQRLQVNDVITEIEGQPAVSPYQLARLLKLQRSHLQVLRQDKLIEITLEQE